MTVPAYHNEFTFLAHGRPHPSSKMATNVKAALKRLFTTQDAVSAQKIRMLP